VPYPPPLPRCNVLLVAVACGVWCVGPAPSNAAGQYETYLQRELTVADELALEALLGGTPAPGAEALHEQLRVPSPLPALPWPGMAADACLSMFVRVGLVAPPPLSGYDHDKHRRRNKQKCRVISVSIERGLINLACRCGWRWAQTHRVQSKARRRMCVCDPAWRWLAANATAAAAAVFVSSLPETAPCVLLWLAWWRSLCQSGGAAAGAACGMSWHLRVRVEMIGSQKCGIAGKSQSDLMMTNPMIFTRTLKLGCRPGAQCLLCPETQSGAVCFIAGGGPSSRGRRRRPHRGGGG
jgi:hypothetical protein